MLTMADTRQGERHKQLDVSILCHRSALTWEESDLAIRRFALPPIGIDSVDISDLLALLE